MPKVSVIVPIYNVETYLPKCMESLVNQTLEEIQIILVNDGSTDYSGEIAKEYALKYPHKILYLEKENGGLSDARNYGMPYATGDYIAFLDSDDYVEKHTYQEMYHLAIQENSDYVECDFLWEYPTKTKKDKRIEYTNKEEMVAKVRVVAWNKLIRKSILEKNQIYFPKGLLYEDVEFTYKLIPHLNRVSYLNQYLIHYVQRGNSIANSQNERTAEIFTILDHVIEYYKKNKWYESYQDALEYNYARYLLCSSLKRMCHIQEKTKREIVLDKTWEKLHKTFPTWKRNSILQHENTMKNMYMKTINRYTYPWYCKILQIL